MGQGSLPVEEERPLKKWIGSKSTDPRRRPFAVIMKSADICNYLCGYLLHHLGM